VGYFGFPWSWVFLPQYFLLVLMCRESWWGHCLWIYLTFFMIYASRLRCCEPFFSMWSSVFVLCCFSFLLNLMLNMTWITGHIHHSIVDKIDPTSEDVEMIKKIPHQLHWVKYIFLWNVNRTEFICCAFNWSVKNTFYEPWRRNPF
jgi:hypothetical protein